MTSPSPYCPPASSTARSTTATASAATSPWTQISDVLAQSTTAVSSGSACTNRPTTILEKLQEEFCLHDLAVEDAQNAHQRPKIEAYGNSLFVALHTAQVVDEQDPLRRNARLPRPALPGHRAPRRVAVLRAGARARGARTGTAGARARRTALYAVLDFIVDNYLPIVDEFRDTLNSLEQDIFAETYSRDTVVQALRTQARTHAAAPGGGAAAGHPGQLDAHARAR